MDELTLEDGTTYYTVKQFAKQMNYSEQYIRICALGKEDSAKDLSEYKKKVGHQILISEDAKSEFS